jgi:hypothetical protein
VLNPSHSAIPSIVQLAILSPFPFSHVTLPTTQNRCVTKKGGRPVNTSHSSTERPALTTDTTPSFARHTRLLRNARSRDTLPHHQLFMRRSGRLKQIKAAAALAAAARLTIKTPNLTNSPDPFEDEHFERLIDRSRDTAHSHTRAYGRDGPTLPKTSSLFRCTVSHLTLI